MTCVGPEAGKDAHIPEGRLGFQCFKEETNDN